MPKRPSRENAKLRKASADFKDDDNKKSKKTEIVVQLDERSESESSYVPSDDEMVSRLLEFMKEEPKQPPKKRQRKRKESIIEPILRLTRKELIYFNTLSVEKKLELNSFMEKIKYFQQESEVPLKFRILSLPISEYTKSSVLKKIESMDENY